MKTTMWIKTYYKSLITLFSLACVSQVLYNYFKFKSRKKKNTILRKEIHEVLFFDSGTDGQRSKHSRCIITKNMAQLLDFLNEPRYSLDICMYVLTNAEITNVLLKLHSRGVIIRIIVDSEMAFTSGSSIRKLEKNGIPIRCMKTTHFMHNKYCVIDGLVEDSSVTPLVITGSLNWTNQALNGNWEDVVITSQSELVRKYNEGFENLWNTFKPIIT